MKIIKISLLFMAAFMIPAPAPASEIFGRISSSPAAGQSGFHEDSRAAAVSDRGRKSAANGGGGLPPAKQKPSGQEAFLPPSPDSGGAIVKGAAYFPDRSLLRAPDKRVYLLSSGCVKHIINLTELEKYAGQKIIAASFEELAQFKKRKYADGDLIRRIGREKVYVINRGRRFHIFNLKNLRQNHFGKEIFNIPEKEMKIYL